MAGAQGETGKLGRVDGVIKGLFKIIKGRGHQEGVVISHAYQDLP